MSLKGIDIQLRIFASKKSPPSSAFGFGDVLECTAQVVCHVDVLFEFPPKTRIETDMLAGPMVETMESVKLYLSYKKGSKWSQPTTAGCRERVQGRAECGPRMPKYHHVTADNSQFV